MDGIQLVDQSVEVSSDSKNKRRSLGDLNPNTVDSVGRLKRRNSVAKDNNIRKDYVSKVSFTDLYIKALSGDPGLFTDHILLNTLNNYEPRKQNKNFMGYPVWAETKPQFFERLLFNHFKLTEVGEPELGGRYNVVDGINLETKEPYEFKYIDPEYWYTNEPRKNCRIVKFAGRGRYIPELFETEKLSKPIEEYVVGKTSLEENNELNSAAKMKINTSVRQLGCLNEDGMRNMGDWYYNTGGGMGEVSNIGHLIIGTISDSDGSIYIEYIDIRGDYINEYIEPLE